MLNIRDDFFNIKLSVLSLLLILHLHEVYILKLQVIFTKKKKWNNISNRQKIDYFIFTSKP